MDIVAIIFLPFACRCFLTMEKICNNREEGTKTIQNVVKTINNAQYNAIKHGTLDEQFVIFLTNYLFDKAIGWCSLKSFVGF